MKIRCEQNSIRLRLKKSEIAKLASEGSIEEFVAFPNGQTLIYALRINESTDQVNPSFSDNSIAIELPKATAEEWINTNTVGIDCTIELDDDVHLELLIEKDFPCIDRPNEDKADTFFELVPDKPDVC